MRGGFEYGYAAREDAEWCIRREGAHRMLCGRRHGFVPAAQPEHPQPVHEVCRKRYDALGGSERSECGLCPACGESVPVVDGMVQDHGDGCVGVNMRPRGAR